MDGPRATSSQPTRCPGRRLATTAPTVAALTAATAAVKLPLPNRKVSSGRPAWRSRRSSQTVAARPSRVSAHSAHASPAGHRPGRLRRATDPAGSVGPWRSPARPSPGTVDLRHCHLTNLARFACQCGRPPSRERNGRRTCQAIRPLWNRLSNVKTPQRRTTRRPGGHRQPAAATRRAELIVDLVTVSIV
jgi:hypothetical protein